MKRIIAPLLILLALAGAAHAFGLGEGNRFGRLGAFKKPGGSGPPPGANLRITNTGDFRITNTGDNRSVSP